MIRYTGSTFPKLFLIMSGGNKRILLLNMASSTRERQEFYCDVEGCGKVFYKGCNLVQHSRVHTVGSMLT